MLPAKNSLKKDIQIQKVLKEGKLVHSESFSVCFTKRATGPSRFAFVISKKISPNASVRNKSKRALREGTRQTLFFAKDGYDCVFLAKPIIIKKYTDELMREVKATLSKAGIIK